MDVLAGLDIATTTGLAVLINGNVLTFTYRGAPKKQRLLPETNRFGSLDPMVEADIGLRFENFLGAWLVKHGVTKVAIEGVITSAGTRMVEEVDTSTEWAGQSRRKVEKGATSMSSVYRSDGLSFLALTVCKRLNIPVWIVGQSTWRKEFTGSGLGKDAKDRAVAECRRLGIEITSKDAAEAVGVLTWLDRTINPSTARRRADDMFARVSSPAG